MKLPPKKSLGQHFLYNPSTIEKILKIAGVGPNDRILEIGPGPGLMTRKLAESAGEVIAVEKDHRFFLQLQEELKSFSNLQLIEADILEWNIEQRLHGGKWKVIANLPYNIATPVIFSLLKFSTLFDSFYLMVQKEVALRLTARPGSHDYGILSVFSQLLSKNRIVYRLPPGAFSPPPRVESAVVEFKIAEAPRYNILHLPTLEQVVQSAFGQRRKMLRNSLKLPETTLVQVGISPTARAEEIPIEQFVQLANLLDKEKLIS